MIKTWQERCEEHEGIVTEQMIRDRMQEEIDELRQAIEFEEMVKRGTKAWADTPDDWVDELRGGAEKQESRLCREIYEVWAGSEGIPVPQTCAEGYLLQLIEEMRDIAKRGLRKKEKNT